ncbi:MAG TPA: 30S ribosomal protein S16 [Nocardioides sp.]|uniref:30S ribosomal protein S16 n=1 Tax=Nocardioides sp. TaxID=35761 RepID=UPI002E370ED9|nr:30S ribosomal protein S16 [Nocardioides sp.]HEX3929703.1 30S ribosomal protein S16 [Nocardioides sp.]
MAVKIRLKRMGKVRAPHYRIVVVDSRKKRDGKVIEEIGLYHPKEDPSYIRVDADRAKYWLGVGAQPSEAVAQLLKITGDWQKFKGYANTEGRLKVAEPKRSKQDIFNEALKETSGEPKGEAVTRRTTKKAAAKTAEPAPAEAEVAEVVAETPAPAEAEGPPEALPEAPAEAPVVAEEAAPVPADETPQGAADVAETAETAEVDADAKSDEA